MKSHGLPGALGFCLEPVPEVIYSNLLVLPRGGYSGSEGSKPICDSTSLLKTDLQPRYC